MTGFLTATSVSEISSVVPWIFKKANGKFDFGLDRSCVIEEKRAALQSLRRDGLLQDVQACGMQFGE